MKNTVLFFASLFMVTLLIAQDTSNKSDDSEVNLIDIPNWFSDPEREAIRKIEAQDSIVWSDYIQLAISYSQLNADESKIEALIGRALKENASDSCKMLNFILKNKINWNITEKYGQIVNDQLKRYECNKQ